MIPVEITVVIFLICGLIIRLYEGSWISPSSVFALVWMFISFYSIMTAPEYYFSTNALFFILVSVFAFFTGEKAPFHFPGVSFLLAALFMLGSLLIAWVVLKKERIPAAI